MLFQFLKFFQYRNMRILKIVQCHEVTSHSLNNFFKNLSHIKFSATQYNLQTTSNFQFLVLQYFYPFVGRKALSDWENAPLNIFVWFSFWHYPSCYLNTIMSWISDKRSSRSVGSYSQKLTPIKVNWFTQGYLASLVTVISLWSMHPFSCICSRKSLIASLLNPNAIYLMLRTASTSN